MSTWNSVIKTSCTLRPPFHNWPPHTKNELYSLVIKGIKRDRSEIKHQMRLLKRKVLSKTDPNVSRNISEQWPTVQIVNVIEISLRDCRKNTQQNREPLCSYSKVISRKLILKFISRVTCVVFEERDAEDRVFCKALSCSFLRVLSRSGFSILYNR